MGEREALQSLEQLLESFLERAVAAKSERLSVLGGINNLDDIAKETNHDDQISQMGDWLAKHSNWLNDQTLRPADKRRIATILEELRGSVPAESVTPETEKLETEIERWSSHLVKSSGGLVLKRPPEKAAETQDTLAQFQATMMKMNELFKYMSASKPHLLSVLDEALKIAELQQNREALILSGFLLYYLRLGGYKVEPYVKRLKDAEKLIPRQVPNA